MKTSTRLLLALAVVVNAALLWAFHDRYWYVIDEGVFAHVAERLLTGEVLNQDVQSLHTGYIHFLNAGAFALFGTDLLSLRYPLFAAAFVQSLLVWRLLVGRGALLATATSIAVTAVGVIQFINPTPHWYSLVVTILLTGWLAWVPPSHRLRTVGAGFLLGLVGMLRQLTGVWVAMAVVVVLLREHDGAKLRGWDGILARFTIGSMLVVTVAYLALAGEPEPGGIVMLASWPIAILAVTLRDVGAPNRATLRLLSELAVGVAVAAVPLIVYHLAHGSLSTWAYDISVSALASGGLQRYEGGGYGLLPLAGLLYVLRPPDLAAFVNGLYWIVLPLVPAGTGILTLWWLHQRHTNVPILGIVSAFYTLVTLHLAGAVYLYFSVGLAVAAAVWLVSVAASRRRVVACSACLALLSVVAVAFHAGQSWSRTRPEAARGLRTVRADARWCPPTPRARVHVEWSECEPYWQLVRAVEAEAPEGSEIFALPNDSAVYFLANRANPFRFYNSAWGILTEEDVAHVIGYLGAHPPRVVAFRPDDTYNDDTSRRVMAFVRTRYERFATIAGVELYRPTSPTVEARSQEVGAAR